MASWLACDLYAYVKSIEGLAGKGVDLWKISDMISVEQKLLEAAGISQDVLGDGWQRAMTLVNIFHLPIAALENGNTTKHCCRARTKH